MQTKIILILLLNWFCFSLGQGVGINTTNPKKDLDVNGSLTIRGPLKNNDTPINSNPGDVLISSGNNGTIWSGVTSLDAGDSFDYILTDLSVSKTRSYIALSNPPSDPFPEDIVLGFPLDYRWTTLIDDKTNSTFGSIINIKEKNSLAVISFATGVSSDFAAISGAQASVASACFTDYYVAFFFYDPKNGTYKLINSKRDTLAGLSQPSNKIFISYTLKNLDVGTYYVIPAFARSVSDNVYAISFKNYSLFIGSVIGVNKFSPFMNQSIIKTEIYVPKN